MVIVLHRLFMLRGQRYEDFEEEYYNQAIYTDTRVESALSTEDQWRGKYGPTGTQIRDLFIEGKDSTLNSSNISDRMRHIREIQSVGSKISTASDDTFAILKNYISSQIPGAKAVHTINVETGELASAAIVTSTECTQWSHQVEQFSKRTNVNPKMHVTDNYPANSELFLAIFGNIILRLGLFHFVQRITRTLKKEHIDFPLAVGWLSSCLYYCDRGDADAVQKYLAQEKQKTIDSDDNIEDNIDELEIEKQDELTTQTLSTRNLLKRFKKYVRIWMFSEGEIRSRMNKWWIRFKCSASEGAEKAGGRYDPETDVTLFTDETKEAFENCLQHSDHITDVLNRNDLYEGVVPSLRSKNQLTIWKGNRGVESMLEKAHHALAHFANGNMRKELADSLSLSGWAQYNLRIRFRLGLQRMEPEDRATIPSSFHSSPSHLDHSRLDHINYLARKAGIGGDVHDNIRVLPPDNGERFLSEYFFQQQQRMMSDNILYSNIGRCGCVMCAVDDNNNNKKRYTYTSPLRKVRQKLLRHNNNKNNKNNNKNNNKKKKKSTTIISPKLNIVPAIIPYAASLPTRVFPVPTPPPPPPFAPYVPYAFVPPQYQFQYYQQQQYNTMLQMPPISIPYFTKQQQQQQQQQRTTSYCCDGMKISREKRQARHTTRGHFKHSPGCIFNTTKEKQT